MDYELLRSLDRALLEAQQRADIRITAQASALLVILIDAIQDDPNERLRPRIDLRSIQSSVIERLPQYLQLISRNYDTRTIDALMLLNFMPRFMSGMCPPFENPPDYGNQGAP